MEEMIKLLRGADGDTWMKCDDSVPALQGAGWRLAQTDEQWGRYFREEFRLLEQPISRKGYGSIFFMGTRGEWVAHFRVVKARGEFQVHRVD